MTKLQLKLPGGRPPQLLINLVAAATLTAFCLVAARALLGQALYQQRVINARHAATAHLKTDLTAASSLATQYQAFAAANPNVIGGNASGQGPSDGSNPQIVLDALPIRYDFAALTSSVEKIMRDRGISVSSINGTDKSLANPATDSPTPAPVTMSLSISAQGNYNNVQALINDLERSIRPFNINSLQLLGGQNSMQLTATLDSYYQPAKVFNLNPRNIK